MFLFETCQVWSRAVYSVTAFRSSWKPLFSRVMKVRVLSGLPGFHKKARPIATQNRPIGFRGGKIIQSVGKIHVFWRVSPEKIRNPAVIGVASTRGGNIVKV